MALAYHGSALHATHRASHSPDICCVASFNRLHVNHFCGLRENRAAETSQNKSSEAASVIRKAILGACVFALSACAGGGPDTRAIVGGAESTVASRAETLPYIVVDVDESIATVVSRALDVTPQFFGDARPRPRHHRRR
jgi:hypothetical protein